MRRRCAAFAGLLALLLLPACQSLVQEPLQPLPETAANLAAQARVNGVIGTPSAQPPAQVAVGRAPAAPRPAATSGPGAYSLDFADADVREVVAQVLGGMLGMDYVIDPAVHGTVTLHTSRKLTREELLPTLQSLLAGNGAVVIPTEGLMRVVPATAAGGANSRIVPLRFVSADELAKVLQPLAGASAKVTAETGLNAVVVSGDPAQIDALVDLVHSFDVDALAGQSYALLPVPWDSARDFAEALQDAFHGRGGASLAGVVRVVPLTRLGAVLVVASQPRYLEEARRIYGIVDRERRETVRSWSVYYLQNSNAEDVAYTLQMAFTPNNVTAVPKAQQGGGRAEMIQQAARGTISGSTMGAGGAATTGIGTGGGAAAGNAGGINVAPATPAAAQTSAEASRPGAAAVPGQAVVSANPLAGGTEAGAEAQTTDTMRVLPEDQNNAVLVYGTFQETQTVEAMLRKIDILPLQVRIDATIAEVTLNDQLQYGTQFFFKSGGINGVLNNATQTVTSLGQSVFALNFPGFIVGGNGQGGAPFALSMLQAVTTVNVLSSPQIMVVDNQPARLQVGSLVPYLTASAVSTISANAPVVNSVGYQPTGVILDVTPRVNSGGLVTLDITQEVSDVSTAPPASGINSPTFDQRVISSRVVVQDGQTIGLAGLIRDTSTRGNSGIPWLKDIPLLGLAAGTQDNERTRTELLVLLTPHVMRDQHDARLLTEDLREALPAAAIVPHDLATFHPSGSDDPNARFRRPLSP